MVDKRYCASSSAHSAKSDKDKCFGLVSEKEISVCLGGLRRNFGRGWSYDSLLKMTTDFQRFLTRGLNCEIQLGERSLIAE
eukprot:747902-Hanusia_phi.AAC.2